MTVKIRIAVIGVGAIGATHVERVLQNPEFQLAAIVDPSATSKEMASHIGTEHYSAFEDFMASARVDAAIVATPNQTHLPLTAALIEAGIAVLLEKPVAEGIGSATEVVRLVERSTVPVLVGHHRRHNPIIEAAYAAIKSGRIGELVTATVISTVHKPDSYFEPDWRRSARTGGPLLINAVHDIDLLRHFFGEIETVQAIARNRRRGLAVEDTAVVTLGLASGALASVTISDAAVGPWAWDLTSGENSRFPSHPASAHFYTGNLAGLSIPDLTLWRAPSVPDWTERLLPEHVQAETDDPYVRQLQSFAKTIRGEREPLVSVRDATTTLCVLEATRTAIETGREVRVAEIEA